jgi:hypothetical protein
MPTADFSRGGAKSFPLMQKMKEFVSATRSYRLRNELLDRRT